jgi:amino acid adenylation domain-containing protein
MRVRRTEEQELMPLDLQDRIASLSPEKRALLDRKSLGREATTADRLSIRRRSGDGPAPLSFSQQRLWFLDQFEPGSPLYIVPSAYRLLGKLDTRALEKALTEVVRRHELLRTTFGIIDGSPVQYVRDATEISIPIVDLYGIPSPERDLEARRRIDEEAGAQFDLERGPLFRANLLRMGPNDHILLLTLHHMVSDEWSRGILMRELQSLYKAYREDRPSPLPELPIQYSDYAAWQRERLEGDAFERLLSYWKNCLSGAPSVLELPTDRPRPPIQTFNGSYKRVELSPKLAQGLKALGQGEGATLFMVLLASLQTLMYRYSSQQDIVIGTPIANRTQKEVEGLIGFFVNTLTIRGDLSGDPTFTEFLGQIKEAALGAYAHQELTFEKLVEELQPERSMSHSPIFQVMFALQNVSSGGNGLEDLQVQPISGEGTSAKFDLMLMALEGRDRLGFWLEYNTDLFDEVRMERLLEHFQILLEGIVANPNERISRLPLLSLPERTRLLTEWNAGGSHFPADQCIHELFEMQVDRTPNAVAVVFEDEHITYAELNRRSNQLAHALQLQGVGPESLVGLFIDRSLEMVVGVLGILKAGAAYVPMDPSYPAERLAFMIQDACMVAIVTRKSLLETAPETAAPIVCIDCDAHADLKGSNPAPSISSANLAYVIYTSGSTGNPKGVLITHANVVRLMRSTEGWFHFDDRDVWTLFHSLAFDFSVWELWGPLLYGGKLIVVPYWISRSPEAFHGLLLKEQVTVLNQTPSAFGQLLQTIPVEGSCKDLAIRKVIFGGEALGPANLQRWYDLSGSADERLINMYGITETTVHVTYRQMLHKDVSSGGISPIGFAIPDLRLHLLGPSMEPVPVGVTGEIFVGGAGLARGYLNRPDLSAERFVPDPFSSEPGSRLYRSGDLARYLPSGDMEYVGRIDHQIKIRGFRIELGEIESALVRHPGVREAVVLAREGGVEKRLVAYVTARDEALNAGDLRDSLRDRLPEYMIPSAFVFLQDLPLTSNGKVDRKSLPAPESAPNGQTTAYIAPRNAIETELAGIFSNLLGKDHIGVDDSFFDLGGHSMIAVRLMIDIEKAFGRKLPLQLLFESATVGAIAQALFKHDASAGWATVRTVTPISAQSRRIPMFCVAAPDVNPLGYVALGRHMGAEQPLFVLQSQFRSNRLKPYTAEELREMAIAYIDNMRPTQHEGPYCLGGMCEGAHLAFEIARQLQRTGEQVSLLVSFDAWPEENTRTRFGWWRHIASETKARYAANRSISFRTMAMRVFGLTMRCLGDWVLGPVRPSRADTWEGHYWPGRNFVPEQVNGVITVFRVKEQPVYRIKRRDLGWCDWATGGVEIHEMPGEHQTMLREPHVSATSAALLKCLDQVHSSHTAGNSIPKSEV